MAKSRSVIAFGAFRRSSAKLSWLLELFGGEGRKCHGFRNLAAVLDKDSRLDMIRGHAPKSPGGLAGLPVADESIIFSEGSSLDIARANLQHFRKSSQPRLEFCTFSSFPKQGEPNIDPNIL